MLDRKAIEIYESGDIVLDELRAKNVQENLSRKVQKTDMALHDWERTLVLHDAKSMENDVVPSALLHHFDVCVSTNCFRRLPRCCFRFAEQFVGEMLAQSHAYSRRR